MPPRPSAPHCAICADITPVLLEPQNRNKAVIVFCVLYTAFIGMCAYTVYDAIQQMEKPPTMFAVADEAFVSPPLAVLARLF